MWGDTRTLEWSIASPAPAYNFASVPHVRSEDAYWDMKVQGEKRKTQDFESIHMPSNTAAGFIGGILMLILGFALVWHIWWLAIISFIATIVTIIAHSFVANHAGYHIPATQVEATESKLTQIHLAKGVPA